MSKVRVKPIDYKEIDEFSSANKDSQRYIDDLNLDITNLI